MAGKAKRKPQGHPARLGRDELQVRVDKLAMQVTELVRDVIRDPRFDPEDVVVSKAGSIAILHLMAVLAGKPTPAEVYGLGKHGYHLVAKVAAGAGVDLSEAEMTAAMDRAQAIAEKMVGV